MMVSSFFMIILFIILHNIFSEVTSVGLPAPNLFKKLSLLNENNVIPPKTALEYLTNLDYKLEALNQIINRMDNSLQNLQEKSHTWVIFQHHINSWNEGIRILENKLDLLKRANEDDHQLLLKLDVAITSNTKINEHYELVLNELKQFLILDRKTKNEISLKINNILRHIQMASICNNERQSSKKSNIITPIGVSSLPQGCQYVNSSNKIEQRLNTLSHQMALQKDLKQLNSLEKRNSKSLENVNKALNNQLDKYEEISARLQKSNECCNSVSSELTTFTESSDTLLKRIEKLVRNVSDRLNDIEVTTYGGVHIDNKEDVDNETDETDIEEQISSGELDVGRTNFKDLTDVDIGSATERLEYDDNHNFEFVRPNLSGCHELMDERTYIDGIYKFSQPNINEGERDFNERYCVFAQSLNDTGLPWTVIQRRGPYLQQENFNRSWSEYRNGFGHLSKDFWFGNEFIHRLVYYDDYELRIELEDFDDTQMWTEYSVFRVDSEKYHYNLLIGGHSGTIDDAMEYHNDNDFSTYDKRNDRTIDGCCSCAMGYGSGWWFNNCSEANLNGIYRNTPLDHDYVGIMWELWRGDYSLKKTRMMVRPRITAIHRTITDSQDYHEFTEDP